MRLPIVAKFGAIAVLVAVTIQSAWAQSPTSLVINFNVATGVPVGAWGVAAAALIIGLLAAYSLRSRSAVASRFVALVGALAATATLSISSQHADALPIVPTNLIVSPATINSVLNGTYTFVNAASGPVTITNVALLNALGGMSINVSGSTCVVGLLLSVGQTCTVAVATAL